MRKSINKSPLKFFIIVYALSIPLWLLGLIIDLKGLPFPITDILAAFTPTIAAAYLVYKETGRNGISELFKRIFDFHRITQKMEYSPIIGLPFLLYFAIYTIIYFADLPLSSEFNVSFQSLFGFFVLFFIGAIAEEVGYMGYVIEPMQARFGALKASVLIGISWAVWHYPSIIHQGHNAVWIAWGTLGTVAVRVLIVWIYNNTGKSLFACILFHTLLNFGRVLFPKDEIHNPLVDYPHIHYSLIAVVAVVVILLWDSKTLSNYRFRNKQSSRNNYG